MRATGSTEDFAEIQATRATLAIGSTRAVPLFAPGAARPASNHTVIIEFLVDDVDGVHQDLAGFVGDFVAEPTTLPWGNRWLLLRDPDGDLVSFFTPHSGRHRKVRSLITSQPPAGASGQKPRDPKIPVPLVTRAGWPPSTADPAGLRPTFAT